MQTLPLSSASWLFRDVTARSSWSSAVVPGCVHRDLLRHDLIRDPFWGNNEAELQWIDEHIWEYRTEFAVPAGLLDEEVVELVADGLDTVATVKLNGRIVARTDNMFMGYRWNVKSALRAGRNELVVRFDSSMGYVRKNRLEHSVKEWNDPVGRSQVIRKEQCQFGWDWGPRFITAGIWRDIRLEGWSVNCVKSVRIVQNHLRGAVQLALTPELLRHEKLVNIDWRLSLDGRVVAEGKGDRIEVPKPQLWWPAGQGAQPLYVLDVWISRADGTPLGEWSKRIGLRTMALDRHADKWGETFQFIVNGRPIFAKGANWIPTHSFVAGMTRADYARDLGSAAESNMNMIRVWGGGIYESEDFYDLCDELGLMIWHDFMFACTLYPGDKAFMKSVREETEYQVGRLRHRACLALWCGNNETGQLNADLLAKSPKLRRNYQALFHQLLPDVVKSIDGATGYWPSSGDRAEGEGHLAGTQRGDTHYWDVWHARHPVKDYEQWAFRFVSEFGMQSYSSPATNATFCAAEDANIFGPVMENHQKNRAGNQIILDYVSRRYRLPKSQDSLIYLSQLNQAHCMQTGSQHYRREMPRCMGALYWQLNDCWPVASWSSIEFTGRWKALQYYARRFFAPALVTAHVPGDEGTTIGNYRKSTVREVHLYTVCDSPAVARGTVCWILMHLDGRKVVRGKKSVVLKPGTCIKHKTLDLAKPLAAFGRDNVYLRISLLVRGDIVSEQTVFLTPPRFLALPQARTRTSIRLQSPTIAVLRFESPVFQHALGFDLAGTDYRASDNYFDLYPGEAKEVVVTFKNPQAKAKLTRQLRYQSLVDSYS